MNKTKLLGWYQIIGGSIGLFFSIFALFIGISHWVAAIIVLVVGVGFFGYSIYCGILLLNPDKIGLGINRSIINQIMQVFSISMFGLSYKYYSGLQLSFGFYFAESVNFLSDLSFLGSRFSIGTSGEELKVMINIIPLIIIYLLNDLREDSKDYKVDNVDNGG